MLVFEIEYRNSGWNRISRSPTFDGTSIQFWILLTQQNKVRTLLQHWLGGDSLLLHSLKSFLVAFFQSVTKTISFKNNDRYVDTWTKYDIPLYDNVSKATFIMFCQTCCKIDDFCLHKCSRIQLAFLVFFKLNSDNRQNGLQFFVFALVIHAVVMENDHGIGVCFCSSFSMVRARKGGSALFRVSDFS